MRALALPVCLLCLPVLGGCSLDLDLLTQHDAGTTSDAGPGPDADAAAPDADAPDAMAEDAGPPGNPVDFEQIEAYENTTCARSVDGLLFCWGRNDGGQLGPNGSDPQSATPVQVRPPAPAAHWIDVAVGARHVCAITDRAEVYCWGDPTSGRTGPDPLDEVPALVSLPDDAFDIAAGSDHSCAVTGPLETGDVRCWGANNRGQLGTGGAGTPRLVNFGENVAEVGAGNEYTCARTIDGEIWCWGDNAWAQLGIPIATNTRLSPGTIEPPAAGTPSYTALEVGPAHACAETSDNDVLCWGDNRTHQVSNSSIESQHHVPQPQGVGFWRTPAVGGSRPGGRGFTCVVSSTGVRHCRGAAEDGQLGLGGACEGVPDVEEPDLIPLEADVGPIVDVAAGARHLCLIDRGRVWCTGDNEYGQLGVDAARCASTLTEVVIELPE